MNQLVPIETRFDGYRFRSRTEARWAVFFKTAGIAYEYEKEGFDFGRLGRYLPDFWLPDLNIWFEVKGADPSEREYAVCRLLNLRSHKTVLLAVGSPAPHPQLILFSEPGRITPEEWWPDRVYFADDRKTEGDFWLMGDDGAFAIGTHRGPDCGKYPLVHTCCARGYDAARAARFEHGETP
jgi:hypothetical protein